MILRLGSGDSTTKGPTGPDVCFDVTTKTEQWGHENSWTIGCHDGSCRECVSIPEKTGGYENHAEYTQECCLPEDQESFLITCTDAFGDGWHGGYLEIDEEKYCDSFSKGNEWEESMPNEQDPAGPGLYS